MKWGRTILIVFGALVVTALGIDAADTLGGSRSTLLSQVIKGTEAACPPGMAVVSTVPGVTCVDSYEASAGAKCPIANPENMVATQRNMGASECSSESKEGSVPWGYVTREQAMQLCARAGKRLPTSEEWYALALGIPDPHVSCNVGERSVSKTGSHASCISPSGAFDIVGNLWEWVSDDVINGVYRSRELPGSGYVAQVDAGGVATAVDLSPQDLFGEDYFWSLKEGAFGIIRGGFYGSGKDAGLYAVHADTAPTTASAGIGFRCVK